MLAMKEREEGFALLEVMLAVMLVLIFSTQVIPRGSKLYRQMVVEYESEHLLAEIRHCQSLSRLIEDNAWWYGARNQEKKNPRIDLFLGHSRLSAGDSIILEQHVFFPGVRIGKIDKQGFPSHEHNNIQISFEINGMTSLEKDKGLMTLLIYIDGYPQEGRKLMISKGGRVRMERGEIEKQP